jgi:hypothetical protein
VGVIAWQRRAAKDVTIRIDYRYMITHKVIQTKVKNALNSLVY